MAYFNACHKMLQEVNNIFFVCQKDKKLLKENVTQFKVATLEVYHLGKSMTMLALKQGLRPPYLTYSMDWTPVRSYSEMLSSTQKYIHRDEGALS